MRSAEGGLECSAAISSCYPAARLRGFDPGESEMSSRIATSCTRVKSAPLKALKLLKMAGNGAQHAQAKGAKPGPWIQRGLFNSDPRTRPSAKINRLVWFTGPRARCGRYRAERFDGRVLCHIRQPILATVRSGAIRSTAGRCAPDGGKMCCISTADTSSIRVVHPFG
jgi:hypothetical protein